MTDPRLYHTISVELCTAAGLFTALTILLKLIADAYLKRFGGRPGRLGRFARFTSDIGEPTAYAMGIGAFGFTFVSMGTGINTWPWDALMTSGGVHNKIMFTGLSQTTFGLFVAMRTKFGKELWKNRLLAAVYSVLGMMGGAIMIMQNSVAGHLAGKGSILDPFLSPIGIDLTHELVLPPLVSILVIVSSCAFLAFTAWWAYSRRKASYG